ncbi:MAG: hypothetical protein IKM20_03350 [Erysipelotrichales bacterium]|nr:hypothetical protein [Erysipelotrichales bacterium]
MQEWFYKEYGFSVSNLLEPFRINDDVYNLLTVYDEKNLFFLNRLCISLASLLNIPKVEIIPTYSGNLFSMYNSQKYVLICGKESNLTLQQFSYIIESSKGYFNMINLDKKRELWLKRSIHLEKEIVPWLPFKELCIETVANLRLSFSLGECAIAYLDTAQNKIIPGGLSHTRLSCLSNLEVLNPIMIVNDHIGRDIVSLYEADKINDYEILDIIKNYSFSNDELIYLVARLLFPARYYDFLEDMYISNSCEKHKEYNFREEYERKRVLVKMIINEYHLPIIDWL